MATFTVWKFHTAEGAEDALGTLERLQSEELITVQDAAIVSWPEGKRKPKTRHLNNLAGAGALGGAFWGFLFGLIFLIPLLGLAVGAATGAWFALVANDRTCPAAVLSARPRSASVGSAGGVADAVLVLVKAGTSVAAYDSCISVIPVSYGATLIARYDLRGAGHGFRHCRPDDSQRGEDR